MIGLRWAYDGLSEVWLTKKWSSWSSWSSCSSISLAEFLWNWKLEDNPVNISQTLETGFTFKKLIMAVKEGYFKKKVSESFHFHGLLKISYAQEKEAKTRPVLDWPVLPFGRVGSHRQSGLRISPQPLVQLGLWPPSLLVQLLQLGWLARPEFTMSLCLDKSDSCLRLECKRDCEKIYWNMRNIFTHLSFNSDSCQTALSFQVLLLRVFSFGIHNWTNWHVLDTDQSKLI